MNESERLSLTHFLRRKHVESVGVKLESDLTLIFYLWNDS